MKDELFDDLITSIKQFGAIRRGEEKPSRVFIYPDMESSADDTNVRRRKSAQEDK